MTLLRSFLGFTNFRNPLLRTATPSVFFAFAIQAAFAIPSVVAQTEKLYDFSGALTYVSVTVLSLCLPWLRVPLPFTGESIQNEGIAPGCLVPLRIAGRQAILNWRQLVLSGAVTVWATRLGSYLFLRILKEGRDSRFERIRHSWVNFSIAWMAQATWISVCLAPVVAINSVPVSALAGVPPVQLSDVIGLSLFVGGFVVEVIADWQKYTWSEEKKRKVHDEEFLTRGLWSKSRHPNYFGESVFWTGIATVAAGALSSAPVRSATGLQSLGALILPYASPAFTVFLLLKVSGVPLIERKYDKRYGERKDYQDWKKNTPMFIPKLL